MGRVIPLQFPHHCRLVPFFKPTEELTGWLPHLVWDRNWMTYTALKAFESYAMPTTLSPILSVNVNWVPPS